MSTLKLVSLQCIRRHDAMGDDEPIVYVENQRMWSGVMGKGETETLAGRTDPYPFSATVHVYLRELSDGTTRAIGYGQPITDRRTDHGLAVFKTSGTHYELEYKVLD